MDSCNSSLRGGSSSPFDCLIFDLDDTLYSSSIGLGEALKKNIDDFLVENCGFPESKASSLRVELFKKYGNSLAGLRALGYDIDADDYHSFVHGRLPYDRIKPDHQLRNLIFSIPQRKIIFTNSDRNHALTCLDRLGLNGCFEQIICFETMNPKLAESTRPDEFPVVLKPSMEAMRIAIEAAEIDPRRTLFLDDNVRNVAAGKAVGLRTVLPTLENTVCELIDFAKATPAAAVVGADGARVVIAAGITAPSFLAGMGERAVGPVMVAAASALADLELEHTEVVGGVGVIRDVVIVVRGAGVAGKELAEEGLVGSREAWRIGGAVHVERGGQVLVGCTAARLGYSISRHDMGKKEPYPIT